MLALAILNLYRTNSEIRDAYCYLCLKRVVDMHISIKQRIMALLGNISKNLIWISVDKM